MVLKKWMGFAALTILGGLSLGHASVLDNVDVKALVSMQARETATGPLVEVWEVGLSNGWRFAFVNRGPAQQAQINLLTTALTQGKKVNIQYASGYNCGYFPQFCYNGASGFVCTNGNQTSYYYMNGVSLNRL